MSRSAFQFGYNTGVINAPGALIKAFINETHAERYGKPMSEDSLALVYAFTIAIFDIGGGIGGLTNGYFADKFGR